MNNAKLIVIDAQNDFMDLDRAALPIPGALDDMNRLARFMSTAGMTASASTCRALFT